MMFFLFPCLLHLYSAEDMVAYQMVRLIHNNLNNVQTINLGDFFFKFQKYLNLQVLKVALNYRIRVKLSQVFRKLLLNSSEVYDSSL